MIVISWQGLPQYAARMIKVFCDQTEEEIQVIGTRPHVAIRGMEEALARPIVWRDETNERLTWGDLGLTVPDIFVQAGWTFQPFVSLGREVKKFGGKVIGLCDNCYRGDLRQYVGSALFRLFYRANFDAMLVPGQSAKRLMTLYGVPHARIACGLYGADPILFQRGPSLVCRSKTFLFVGQFIKRKGVDILCRAFVHVHQKYPEWRLRLCGDGPLREQFIGLPGVIVDNFVQPEQLPEIYHQARFFVLPSLEENWGLVVHEAVLCGCALVLSDVVGAAHDLASSANSVLCRPGNEETLYHALCDAVAWDNAHYESAQSESYDKAKQFGPAQFATALEGLIQELRVI